MSCPEKDEVRSETKLNCLTYQTAVPKPEPKSNIVSGLNVGSISATYNGQISITSHQLYTSLNNRSVTP